jgi:hypothetical protein
MRKPLMDKVPVVGLEPTRGFTPLSKLLQQSNQHLAGPH